LPIFRVRLTRTGPVPNGCTGNRLQRLYPKTALKSAVRTVLIPMPKTRGGQPSQGTVLGGQTSRDTELLAWRGEVISSLLADQPGAAG
jgi:transcription-repair coupling factor (superfamily II helicase)